MGTEHFRNIILTCAVTYCRASYALAYKPITSEKGGGSTIEWVSKFECLG